MNQTRDDVAIFQTPDGVVTLDVRVEGETVWLTQKQMAMLFDTERSVITKHLRNVFAIRRIARESNVQKMHILLYSDKPVEPPSMILTLSSPSAIGSIRNGGHNSASGQQNVLRDHII